MMRSSYSRIGASLLILLLVLQGCSSDNPVETAAAADPPALPELATMKLDLSFFEAAEVDQQSIDKGALDGLEPTSAAYTKLNFLNAAVRVLFLDVVVYTALVEPVAAFALAVHSVPQPQPDGSWLWTYIYMGDGGEYRIYLYGKQMERHVAWRLEVSSTDPEVPLDHFIWFEGEVQNDNESGFWQFYEPAEGVPALISTSELETPGTPTIRIDWEDRVDGGLLELLVNQPDSPSYGSALTFSESPDMCYIAFYDAVDVTTGTITWYPDGSGSIEWPDYRDGELSCWDTMQYDVDCAPAP